jgi:hypothetical protein
MFDGGRYGKSGSWFVLRIRAWSTRSFTILEASGVPRDGIRVLSEPRDIAGNGMMSTPHTDFEVDLVRELRKIGAADADAQAYVQRVGVEESSFLPRVRARRPRQRLSL